MIRVSSLWCRIRKSSVHHPLLREAPILNNHAQNGWFSTLIPLESQVRPLSCKCVIPFEAVLKVAGTLHTGIPNRRNSAPAAFPSASLMAVEGSHSGHETPHLSAPAKPFSSPSAVLEAEYLWELHYTPEGNTESTLGLLNYKLVSVEEFLLVYRGLSEMTNYFTSNAKLMKIKINPPKFKTIPLWLSRSSSTT